MNDERLNRYLTQENLRLRSENSQLQNQMEAKDNMLQSKDSEILRLLNQIASGMLMCSDVYEMKAMAAEYESIIASLKSLQSESYN